MRSHKHQEDKALHTITLLGQPMAAVGGISAAESPSEGPEVRAGRFHM